MQPLQRSDIQITGCSRHDLPNHARCLPLFGPVADPLVNLTEARRGQKLTVPMVIRCAASTDGSTKLSFKLVSNRY